MRAWSCAVVLAACASHAPREARVTFAPAPPRADADDACQAGDVHACARIAATLDEHRHGEGAIPYHQLACDGGVGASCEALGWAYHDGLAGCPADETIATAYHEKAIAAYDAACAIGDPSDCYHLGQVYADGLADVAPDAARATELFQRACDRGVMDACDALARRGVAVSSTSLDTACKDADACTHVGLRLELGVEDTPRDPVEALAKYKAACQDGSVKGCLELGFAYQTGVGTDVDDDAAAKAYRRACSLGTAADCVPLGLAYADGRGIAASDADAVRIFEDACSANEPAGCAHLTSMMADGRVPERRKQRVADLYQRICDRGDAATCIALARMLALGDGVTPDVSRGETILKDTCSVLASAAACVELGAWFEVGDLLEKSEEAAAAWYAEGCKLADSAACNNLQRVNPPMYDALRNNRK